MIEYQDFHGPLGPMLVAECDQRLIGVWFDAQKYYPDTDTGQGWRRAETSLLTETVDQLRDYFETGRRPFDLPLAPQGTAFQRAVWSVLQTIPAGETATYGEVAKRLGEPKAVRAVGAAVGRNPLSIIIPCHRVVGANGSLTGYAAGVERKAWLLDLENGQRGLLTGPMAFVPPSRS